MLPGVDHQTRIRANILFPFFWVKTVSLQCLSQIFLGRIYKEIDEDVLSRIRIYKSAIAYNNAFEIPNIEPIPISVHYSLVLRFIVDLI